MQSDEQGAVTAVAEADVTNTQPQAGPAADVRRPGRLAAPTTLLWLLAALMAMAGAALTLPDLLQFLSDGTPPSAWWLLVPLFAVTEVLVIHLPTLRNAHSHTLREVPAVAGLVFLSSGEYVAAYVLGAGLALLVARKQRGLKLTFNLSMFFLEAALGSVVYQALVAGAEPGEARGWLAALAAVLATDLVSAVAVTVAISVTENSVDRGALRDSLAPGLLAALVNTCMALLVVVLVVREPIALSLVAVVLAVLVVVYRAHVALSTGYARLQHLYEFVRSAERPADVDQAVLTVLADARKVMRADRAELVVLPDGGEPGARFSMDRDAEVVKTPYTGATPESDAWWAPAALGQAVLRTDAARSRGTERPTEPGAAAPKDGMASPLHVDGRVSAVLLVKERAFQKQTYSPEDLRLFETLAAHAAVALDKARLVDHLRRVAAEREHEARHDPLTGLPNRRAFQEAVAALAADGLTGAVMFLDLDDFKDVNDTLGHDAGDILLQKTGEHLRQVCPGIVARLGGDEFAVLLPCASADEALVRARELHAATARPVVLETFTMVTKVSIGVALIEGRDADPNELLRQADIAMYEAKNSGTGVELYRPEDGRAVARKLVLAADLPAAVDAGELTVCYQPQADAATGRIVGAEALLRWEHPTYGPVPPPEIIMLAERVGHLRPLTDAVLREALHQRAVWAAAGFELTVSVNITALDLRDEGLPETVEDLLVLSGTPARALTLEITEQGVMEDPDRCVSVLDRLAAIGVRLSVDDFGTGYSSLAYLERLPVHEVKIDKSFVQRLDLTSSDDTVIRATITLAHDLGMHVVAEGIETRVAWAQVARLGCELVQGYALARPLRAADTLPWLRDHVDVVGAPHRDGAAARLSVVGFAS